MGSVGGYIVEILIHKIIVMAQKFILIALIWFYIIKLLVNTLHVGIEKLTLIMIQFISDVVNSM